MSSKTTTTKPTLVLIHGAWHKPIHYHKLTAALSAHGYDLQIPPLPSMNLARPPTSDLYGDSKFIHSYISSLLNGGHEKVIVIMHSYGGQVGTNALSSLSTSNRSAQNLPGGVVHLIYVVGFALPEGKSMFDKVAEFGDQDLVPIAFPVDEDGTGSLAMPELMLMADGKVEGIDEKEMQDYVGQLGIWNRKGMFQAIGERSAWRDIPSSYVHTLKDMTVPLGYQRSMVEGMRKDGREVKTVDLETSHCAGFTAPEKVAGWILKVAEEHGPEKIA